MSNFYLSDLSSKDKPWDYHRALADQVRDLYKGTDFEAYVDRMFPCARSLVFILSANDFGELLFRLETAWFCRVRHCPICQWRRGFIWKARFYKALPFILADHPEARWIFLTLTVRNCDITELRDTLGHMNKAWKRLSQRKIFPASGWVKSVEVTRNKQDGTAHPHFHALMMVPPVYFTGHGYIKQPQWRELWQDCLKVDYLPQVDVRAVKAKSFQTGGADPGAGLTIAIKEVLKYSVKGEELIADASWLVELTHQLHKTRAIALGGLLKTYLSEADPDTGDLIHPNDGEDTASPDDIHWEFSWKENLKRYIGQQRSFDNEQASNYAPMGA